MARLIVHVEGQTEETFVNDVLASHLQTKGYGVVAPRIIGNARIRRGGVCEWQPARDGIVRHLKDDRRCIVTTMVDYYGLPSSWPGRNESKRLGSVLEKGALVQRAIHTDVTARMGPKFDGRRLLPFIMMYEFEALLFSDCAAFCRIVGQENLEESLQQMRNSFATPEDINDSPVTAPSKRLRHIFPRYEKPLFGSLGILEIGLEKIRAECPHFNTWLLELEAIAATY